MKEKVLYFALGSLFGVVASAIPLKIWLEKKYAKENKKFKEEYRRKLENKEGELLKEKENLIKQVEQVNEIGKKIAEEKIGTGKKKINTEKTNYQAHFVSHAEVDPAEEASPVEGDEVDEEYLTNKHLNDARGSKDMPPELIEYDEYGTNPVYETMELYLYGDGVIADENDEIIEDPPRLIGTADEYLIDSGLKNCYVRNYELGIDVDLTIVDSKYSDIAR